MSYFFNNYKHLSYPIADSKSKGFRNAQLGALNSISSHFTIHDKEPAIVVMPTGSGKTGVLYASAFSLRVKRVLIITPSKLVRNQIAEGFHDLEVLTKNDILPKNIDKPKVFEVSGLIDTQEKWENLKNYDVVVSTPNGLPIAQWGVNPPSELFDLLLVDEAHHSAANTWNSIIQYFKDAKKILFTATPFRRDKKEIKGKFIYDYPISKAFSDGIFGTVDFIPVQTDASMSGDICIAKTADKIFKIDKAAGLWHSVLVRTNTKKHAKILSKVYADNTSLKLKQIDSNFTANQVRVVLDQLTNRTLDGVICVDMLGEGFDFPNLKIGVIHEPHQSLAITLQFIGRFARTNAKNIGSAKFLAIPNEINFLKLELYAEGAIWMDIIREVSEKTIKNEIEVRETLSSFEDKPVDFEDNRDISLFSLKPLYHVKIYNVDKGIDITQQIKIPDNNIDKHFVSEDLAVAVFLTKEVKKPRWLVTDELLNVNFNLIIVFHDDENNLLYINSTRKSIDTYRQIATQYLGEAPLQLSTEYVHRVIGKVEDPEVFNLGLRNKNSVNNAESYLIKAGSHVQKALKTAELNLYEGGHLFLRGKEDGVFKTIGYSSSSKVWSNYSAKITDFIKWCILLSAKINSSEEIKTFTDLDKITFKKVIKKIPNDLIFAIWNSDCYKDYIQYFYDNGKSVQEGALVDLDINIIKSNDDKILLSIGNADFREDYSFDLENFYVCLSDKSRLYAVDPDSGELIELAFFLQEIPLLFYFQDFSALRLNEITNSILVKNASINLEKIFSLDWSDTDIDCEFDGNSKGRYSIHGKLEQFLKAENPEILIYDHGTGEIADFISIKELSDSIEIKLFHCKGAGAKTPGNRVGDFYELCGQSIKSCIWATSTVLKSKMLSRLKRNNPSLFILGDLAKLNAIMSINKMVRFTIIAVQPGLAKNNIDKKIHEILSATECYIEQGDGLKFKIIAS